MDQTDKMVLIGDLISAVASRERERCAKLCDEYAAECGVGRSLSVKAAKELAQRIRELK